MSADRGSVWYESFNPQTLAPLNSICVGQALDPAEAFDKAVQTVTDGMASMQATGECRAPLVTIVWWCARQIVRAWVGYAG